MMFSFKEKDRKTSIGEGAEKKTVDILQEGV